MGYTKGTGCIFSDLVSFEFVDTETERQTRGKMKGKKVFGICNLWPRSSVTCGFGCGAVHPPRTPLPQPAGGRAGGEGRLTVPGAGGADRGDEPRGAL